MKQSNVWETSSLSGSQVISPPIYKLESSLPFQQKVSRLCIFRTWLIYPTNLFNER
jgi:hypothetical protein